MDAAKVFEPPATSRARLCGPEVLWNWLILDIAFVMVLMGGSTVLRSKGAPPLVWIAFGTLSTLVGGVLFASTYTVQTAMAAASAGQDAIGTLQGAC